MKKYLLLCFIAFVLSLIVLDSAQALRLTVKRVIFEGAKRAEVVTVINNSLRDETYRVGWRHFVMTQEDSLKAVPDDQLPPEVKPVVDMIRYAPRRFTVKAKSSQQIRLMLRTPGDLPEGEYRSHLWIRPEPKVDKITPDGANNTSTKTGVELQMLTGVTMPIIVRKGNLGAKTTITGLQASRSPGFVSVAYALNRVGERSVYGNIDYVCNVGSGSEYILRTTRGIAVYPEINQRIFNKQFEKAADKPACSALTVRFKEVKDIMSDEGVVLTEMSTTVQ